MPDKKIILEQSGKQEEISKKKLQEMQGSPDYQVTTQEDGDTIKARAKKRLMD